MLKQLFPRALLATLGVRTGPRDVDGVRESLAALAETLSYKGNIHDTYAPVLDKAADAYHAMALVTDGSIPLTRADSTRETLERLIQEGQYFVHQSSDPDYNATALESDAYLTANVDEWQFTVEKLSERLEEPLCDITWRQPFPGHEKIFLDTEPGTMFADRPKLPEMVVIPTGSYIAGATVEEHDKWKIEPRKRAWEYPQRNVTIHHQLAFSRTEITVRQFRRFISHTCYQPRGGARWWDPKNVSNFGFNPELSWDKPGFNQTDEDPVVAITRNDARAYARWVSLVSGAVYRLPTEDEWEWAARGGTNTTFFWGDELAQAPQYANTYDNSSALANHFRWPSNKLQDGFPWTAPVASFKPNGFGLYDMTANAREFMADDWVPDLSTLEASRNNGTVHKGALAPFVTVRGGAWNYNPDNLRINYRSGYTSSEVATNMFGIRLVRELY